MKKSAAKLEKHEVSLDQKTQKDTAVFENQLKLVTTKLGELSEISGKHLSLVGDDKKVIWSSKPKRKGPAGAGRPEKAAIHTTVGDLHALRATRARKISQNKKKTVTQKKAEATSGKSQPQPFSVSRQPAVVKRKKRA